MSQRSMVLLVRAVTRALVACLVAASSLVVAAAPARAAFMEVNSLADSTTAGDGQCTLREAIENANADDELSDGDCVGGSGHDLIVFTTGTGTIELNSRLNVRSSLAIIGPVGDGMNLDFTGPNIGVGGSGANLVLERVHMRSYFECAVASLGAALRIDYSRLICPGGVGVSTGVTLVVNGSTIRGTHAIEVAGGADSTTIRVNNSDIAGVDVNAWNTHDVDVEIRNSTVRGSIGVYVDATDDSSVSVGVFDSVVDTSSIGMAMSSRLGGEVFVSARVERSTILGASRGISLGGTSDPGFLTIVDSTIEGSTEFGIWRSSPGSILVSNSTITGNGDGIKNTADSGSISVVHTTVTNNQRGIYTEAGTTTITENSIVAGNTTDCAGEAPSSRGHNVVGIDCGIVKKSSDKIGTSASPIDAKLDPLGDNGGPTQTHALRENSPAVDLVTDCNPWWDQRGIARPIPLRVAQGSAEAAAARAGEIFS